MDILSQYAALVDGVKLTLLVALIITNFVTGIAVAIKSNTFHLKEMAGFLYSRVLPYIVGYLGVGVVALVDKSWEWAVTAVWAIILATLVGAILQNLEELGVKIPDFLAGNKQ